MRPVLANSINLWPQRSVLKTGFTLWDEWNVESGVFSTGSQSFHKCTQEHAEQSFTNTVEPALKDHPIGHKNMVSQDRWSLVTGSVALKCGTFCQEYVVLQGRWSLIAVVFQDRFHCNGTREPCLIRPPQILRTFSVYPEPKKTHFNRTTINNKGNDSLQTGP